MVSEREGSSGQPCRSLESQRYLELELNLVEAHLAVCLVCRTRHAAELAFDRLIRRKLRALAAPPDLPVIISALIASERQAR